MARIIEIRRTIFASRSPAMQRVWLKLAERKLRFSDTTGHFCLKCSAII